MVTLLVYAAVLLLGVLISEYAARSVLSTAVLFLAAGWLAGEGGTGLLSFSPGSPEVSILADLALFSILFTDGMRSALRDIARAWRLPGRALFFGLPLTLAGTAAAAHWLAGLPWPEALLLGAILSPTDPVFAAAIVGRKEVPERVRHLLNVESGLNDGLALPFVVGLLAYLSSDSPHAGVLTLEVVSGVVLGVAVPWLALRTQGSRFFSVHESHKALFVFSMGMLIFAIAAITHANSYLAAFAGGITVATVQPEIRESFRAFAEPLTELLKLAALLVFGALLTPALIADLSWWDFLFALVALVAVRPLAVGVSLLGEPLSWKETFVIGWFGPKGFASVVYGLLILKSSAPHAEHLFHLVALVVAGSIVAHSSTDVLIARWFAAAKTDPAR